MYVLIMNENVLTEHNESFEFEAEKLKKGGGELFLTRPWPKEQVYIFIHKYIYHLYIH